MDSCYHALYVIKTPGFVRKMEKLLLRIVTVVKFPRSIVMVLGTTKHGESIYNKFEITRLRESAGIYVLIDNLRAGKRRMSAFRSARCFHSAGKSDPLSCTYSSYARLHHSVNIMVNVLSAVLSLAKNQLTSSSCPKNGSHHGLQCSI